MQGISGKLRTGAKNNNVADMILDRINEEIRIL